MTALSKRFIVRIVAALALSLGAGATLNYIVAWGAVPWPWPSYSKLYFPYGPVTHLSTWPYPFVGELTPRDGDRVTTFAVDIDETPTYWGKGAEGYRYGLPFRSLTAWTNGWHGPSNHGSAAIASDWQGAIFIPYNSWRPKGLVFNVGGKPELLFGAHPIWPGFALNTLFYAALAGGLWQIPLALRRRNRRRACKCVKCGYSLAGLAQGVPCPECGHASVPS